MGAMWLEAFCGSTEDGLPDGVGENKHTESAFMVVPKRQMKRPLWSSAVATELHDEPNAVELSPEL